MKVLHLVPTYLPAVGGVENFVFELVNAQRRKIEVEVFTSNVLNLLARQRIEIKKDFPYVRRFGVVNMLPFLPKAQGVFSLNMLKEVLKKEDVDVIHSHSYRYFTTYIGSIRKLLMNTKHVIQAHSSHRKRRLSRRI
jgi:glycosyltransferase involved in cell wall biosynthesis